MTLKQIALRFLQMGSTGFGGPMALIGLMQQKLVDKGDVSQEDFGNGVALGQILPGPQAMNCAAYLGFRLKGLAGALAATSFLLLPPFVLMLILTPLYFMYGTKPQINGFFNGVGPAVVAVILATAWRMSSKFITGGSAVVIAVFAFAGGLLTSQPILIHENTPKWILSVLPVFVIIISGLLGMIIRGRQQTGGEK